MHSILKIEIKRTFLNRAFLTALLVGSLIAVMQVWQVVLPVLQYMPQNVSHGLPPHSVYNKWISRCRLIRSIRNCGQLVFILAVFFVKGAKDEVY